MISDVTRMGEWSPEATGGRWVGRVREPQVGAAFWGVNRNRWHRWATFCRITEADVGRRFAFDSKLGFPFANWAFDFEPTPAGCKVTQTWTDRRNPVIRRVGWLADGVRDRPAHNAAGMEETLDRLAAAAEAPLTD